VGRTTARLSTRIPPTLCTAYCHGAAFPTELPNMLEKAAGTIQDKLKKE
jgi:hypothetical protein